MRKNEISFYTVSDKYISYLRSFDNKVHHQYPNGESIYVGIVLKTNGINYFVPLSSYSENKDKKMKKRNRLIIRLFEHNNLDNPLGYLLFNNMIPVPESELFSINLDLDIKKHRMMQKQLIFMKGNLDRIENKAKQTYRKRLEEDEYFIKMCCDFQLLEEKYLLYYSE
ncbi:type III toxin-antitoxin system ToxN/AbiQ family toxin [Macrococcoides bohemicum]|uniref:type III toxin-antitoxin system ToxN/AbiQ family toxin n=1 Tax=Macrococcoides bohemicum TaxID=1903056 RepID=UPI0010592CCA|nr:type III toxin-antitoxin system ToxN/AbiQ family toxin [Macrococcus bohemicus]TDL33487.1 type III toxin-antitoxin system ToxN/AbiQ family toxin [Macrococcus bohemicus]